MFTSVASLMGGCQNVDSWVREIRPQCHHHSAGLVIEKLRVRIPAGAAGELSSLWSTFRADSYFGISSTPCVAAVARKRFRSFCQKCS